jgi:hypothetical protein
MGCGLLLETVYEDEKRRDEESSGCVQLVKGRWPDGAFVSGGISSRD